MDHRDVNEVRRMVLLLEYDGSRYKGFQWQVHVPTVQAEIEKAIERFTGESLRIRGASRTDTGVHARGQVVDFLTRAPYTTYTFTKALNWYLPVDIRVKGAFNAPLDFHSRKDALSRTYRYTLLNTEWQPALLRDFCHWVPQRIDMALMDEAGKELEGTHDFTPFTVSLPPDRSPVRTVMRWNVWREEDLVLIESEASGFLPHQIRRTNGILMHIGSGKLSVEVIKDLISGKLRELKHCPSLPAKGLCLMKVKYPNFPSGTDCDYETT